ncbi:putative phage tail assembly chaperone [Aeromonas enteropelogenes]|uniref:putative phage tail assembly chaperone n=1 Tax=Aeromonas enteropelogenes TaxID=29489 RepID=UPI003BA228E6
MSHKIITLTIAGTDIRFAPNMTAHNGYINEMTPHDKVGPSKRYLDRVVHQEDKPALKGLLDTHPGLAFQLAQVVVEQYAPIVEIEVKN